MDLFYGFDLGDAESAVAVLKKSGSPTILPVRDAGSFITACAILKDGTPLIGENACYHPDAVKRALRFKSRFLTDPAIDKEIKSFAGAVLGELYGSGALIQNTDTCFYVGCPAGWKLKDRERYREIFEQCSYPPTKIISESRAALVSACRSKHLQISYDITNKPVLVIDVGSSTTDFAYICSGREVELKTAGEVKLGGGIMDELLIENALNEADKKTAEKARAVFKDSEPWYAYASFAARRLKEKYFSDETYFENNPCRETVVLHYKRPVRLSLVLDAERAKRLYEQKTDMLGGRSFKEVFINSLKDVKKKIDEKPPELIFLTGGVSRLPAMRSWCEEVFPDAITILGAEPEYSVAKGLAWCGCIDDELREFKKELAVFTESTKVEDIVRERIDGLYHATVDAMVEPIIRNAALPVIMRWRKGEIRRLAEIDGEIERNITAYLATDEARKLMVAPVTAWLKTVASALEEYTVPICVNHDVPYTALSINTILGADDIELRIDARSVFQVEELTWLIDAIISVLIGLLCGGSGIVLIAEGLPGVIAGVVISLMLLFLGKEKMEGALMNWDIPGPMRKLIPAGYFDSRVDSICDKVKENFFKGLGESANDDVTMRMVNDISSQIEQCLTRMAEVVEIPLG